MTSSTETLNSSARKWRKRALSSTPAMPTTMLCGRPENWRSAQTIASSGLVMQMTNAFGAYLDALADRRHDLEIDAEQIVAAHAGLARHAGGDDDDVGALDVGIGVGALELRVETLDRRRLARCRALCPAACPRRCRTGRCRPVPSEPARWASVPPICPPPMSAIFLRAMMEFPSENARARKVTEKRA